ncbi:hypothetical protein RHO12_04280 [Orbus sturtevantii]
MLNPKPNTTYWAFLCANFTRLKAALCLFNHQTLTSRFFLFVGYCMA